jgi:hypothetical protein
MNDESHPDPRNCPLAPTAEEIEEWTAREQQRRGAWLAGPDEDEKQEWARRYRWRARLGLEESRLGPTRQEADAWAEREHKRRAAWASGPTEAEKQRWATEQRHHVGREGSPPDTAEIESWATREAERRANWLAGPSDAEKRAWARRQSGEFIDDLMSLSGTLDSDLPDTARNFLREAQLVTEGAVYTLARAPLILWSRFVRAGRAFEEEFYDKPRRSRVRC